MPSKRGWSVYMVRCRDGSLYTGIATDVRRRISEHRDDPNRSARYLRGRGPLKLVLRKKVGPRSVALKMEARVKRLTRAGKEELLGREGRFERLLQEVRGGPARPRRTGRPG